MNGTYAWEQRKFSDVAFLRRGLTYKPSDVQTDGTRVLRSSNIYENNFILKKDDIYVKSNIVNEKLVENGDILITAANGSSKLVGKHAIVKNIEDKTIHGGFMLLASSENPNFVNTLMSSQWYGRFIHVFVSGGNGAIGNLNKSDLANQYVYIPLKDEQQQIGYFFQQLDNLITLHQRKPFSRE